MNALGLLITAWLGLIYWKCLSVEDKCFRSDLMAFNVWEELTWCGAATALPTPCPHRTERGVPVIASNQPHLTISPTQSRRPDSCHSP